MHSPAKFAPIMLVGAEAKAIHDALMSSGHAALATMIASKGRRSEIDRQFIAALPRFDDSDFDVDDEPVVSASEDGAYVMVWRWIANEDAGFASEHESSRSSMTPSKHS